MEKIKKLRKLIKKFNIDGYLVPKNDEYFLEYLKVDRDRLRFITNFTGSFGFSIILQKEKLFVCGRKVQSTGRKRVWKKLQNCNNSKKNATSNIKKKIKIRLRP